MKYLHLHLPTTNEHVIYFNRLKEISWSKANVADFWAVRLASVQIKHTSIRHLRWIVRDNNNIYYNALDYATLSLVCQYVVMAVNMLEEEIFCVRIKDLL